MARALTPLSTLALDLFDNVRLRPESMPIYQEGSVTYLFGDGSVAMLFKLTFANAPTPTLFSG